MPAVTYGSALDTMHEHGDDVLEYIEDCYGEVPTYEDEPAWSAWACYYLSIAVELHCSEYEDLADWDDEENLS
jgi:hypothetical protein